MDTKVAIVRCPDYEPESVYNAIEKAVNLIGGMKSFVKPGQRVLLKPNLLSAKPPESGIDTHPEFARAVVRLVRSAGGDVSLGDTPGGSIKRFEDVLVKSGMQKMAQEEKLKLAHFGKFEERNGIPIAKEALDTDVLISLPKFKTHNLMTFTGAIKNCFGLVPGLYKAKCHMDAPHPDSFAKIILDVFEAATPRLIIMDGILGIEGEGPASAGTPRNFGLVLASSNAVGLDAVCAVIMGLKPQNIPALREAKARGLKETDLSRIEVAGEELKDVIVKDLKLPKTTLLHRLPNSVSRFLASFIKFKVAVTENNCIHCGACVRGCPAGAMKFPEGKGGDKEAPKVDYDKCIFCLCCHEFCPERAVYVKESFLAKIIRT